MTKSNESSLQTAMNEMVVVGSPEEETKTTDEEAIEEEKNAPESTGKDDQEKDDTAAKDQEEKKTEEVKPDVTPENTDTDSTGTTDADTDGKGDADSDANSDADSDGADDQDGPVTGSRLSSRIKQLTEKARESDERYSAAEQRAIEAERKAAEADARLRVKELDELDFDSDEEFEAAKQAILDEVPKVQTDPMREYQLIEASNTIVDAGAEWEGKPPSFFEDLQKAPFGDDTLVDIAALDHSAQVAHAFARRPHQLALINRMTPEQRKPILETVEAEVTAKAKKTAPTTKEVEKSDAEKTTDNDTDGGTGEDELTPTGAIPAAPASGFEADSIDAMESKARKGGGLW